MTTRNHNYLARVTYLIEEDGTDYIKVGVTKSVHTLKRRLQNEATSNPRELRIVHTWKFAGEGYAHKLEQSILRNFKEHRVRRTEWLKGVTVEEILEWHKQLTSSSDNLKVCVMTLVPIPQSWSVSSPVGHLCLNCKLLLL